MINYTQEQLDVIKACNNTNETKIIAVNACAGSGKSSTCGGIVKSILPKYGFYTAFNRAIVEDSNKKFGDMIPCRTIHSLAYKYANSSKKGIKTLTYKDITTRDEIKDKVQVINTIEDFCLSKYTDIDEYFKAVSDNVQYRDDVLLYLDKLLNGEINPTFSFLLKKFHLMLLDKVCNPYFDLFILDECQDSSEVVLEIFKLLDAERKVILGDKYQNIYSFMNTVNAFEELHKDELSPYQLTKSFRCVPSIGDEVERYGQSALTDNYRFEGCLNNYANTGKVAYLCKLNANLIRKMAVEVKKGTTFKLIRDVNSIFEFPIALENCVHNKPVFSNKYKYLEDIREEAKCTGIDLLRYIQKNDKLDEHTKFTAELLEDFIADRINLYNLRSTVNAMKPNPNFILSTVHAFKGLEADLVMLDSDLTEAVDKVVDKATPKTYKVYGRKCPPDVLRENCDRKMKETLNLMYVGMSRARTELIGGK